MIFIQRHSRRLLLLAISVGVTMLAVASADSLRTALQIGPDEQYEMMKGLLWANGVSLYDPIWNDQPPLFTVILGLSFKAFGTTVGVARIVAACFGASLFAAFCLLVHRRCGALAAGVGTFCLLTTPEVFELSVSAMLEVPAIGTALWALWPVLQWREKGGLVWLALSAAATAVALQIKLTAAVVVPALAIEILVGQGASGPVARRLLLVGLWGAGLALFYAGLGLAFGNVPADVLWRTHFDSATLTHTADSPPAQFLNVLCLHHAEAALAVVAGYVLVVRRRQWRQFAFPTVWLLTVTIIHSFHRPWWSYYYLHFAVPLAWMGGYGLAELAQGVQGRLKAEGFRHPLKPVTTWLAVSLLFALVIASGESRLSDSLRALRARPASDRFGVIAKMRQFAGATTWVYTPSPIYAFHAHLRVIPELAVVPLKRIWSEQVSAGQIFTLVQRYRPQQLLLDEDPFPEFKRYVEANYVLVYESGSHRLFVARSLVGN